ncbi:penicillin-insensitive murein endopeptidase [Oceaniovalibus guishaninsula JLT2003]|uniref:Penicillin-insensitive murein endopeptidase n=1 Tax=Oceaniovalibus guishaninsula JLT2003 TaxID=1231392 RepID=K2HEN7_9RHOB|nr:penicillin-insensitive murein endopeptidase [Oceaniovalibus guishaninsula]EKE44992.1 penicillin-insensitive murein endopeptidase [Oceaniovalibus guishaninsula JLT2003]
MKRLLLALTLLAACGGGATVPEPPAPQVTRSGVAKQLFGSMPTAASLPPAPYGGYSKGCLAGGAQLPETGPTWQAMRLSRNRNWAHPTTVDFVQDLSRKAAALPGTNGLYVGDMSQPRGGPMLTGHASHQIGLDADIWLMPATLGLSQGQRESLSAVSFRRAGGAFTNDRWSRIQHEIVKAAASDPRVARIFIFPGAKVRMCADETGDRTWLRKVRPWAGHHYHFHVRLNCPAGASGCVAQDPIPPGDGCADAQAWVNNILNPPPARPRDPNAPPPKPRRDLTMADLPQQCQAVLAR